MRRRDLATLFSGARAWVAAARAQEPRRLIRVLGSSSYGAFQGEETAFIKGLKATGWVPQHQTRRRETLQHDPASAAVTTHRLGKNLYSGAP